jgi:hypothetical protein
MKQLWLKILFGAGILVIIAVVGLVLKNQLKSMPKQDTSQVFNPGLNYGSVKPILTGFVDKIIPGDPVQILFRQQISGTDQKFYFISDTLRLENTKITKQVIEDKSLKAVDAKVSDLKVGSMIFITDLQRSGDHILPGTLEIIK